MNTEYDTTPDNLVVFLRSEFKNRCKKNKAYSLRAFSKFLEVDASNLTKVLKGERKLSKQMVKQICEKLGLKTSAVTGKISRPKAQFNFLPLADQEFNSISEWHYFAILEFLKIPTTQFSEEDLAHRLSLERSVVSAALIKLQSLGLIREDRRKWSVNSQGNIWSSTTKTTDAKKALQKVYLEKSLEALANVPFERRDHSSLTVAIDKKRLPEFKEKIRQIRHDLSDFFQDESSVPNEVYQLTVSFYPLTKITMEDN